MKAHATCYMNIGKTFNELHNVTAKNRMENACVYFSCYSQRYLLWNKRSSVFSQYHCKIIL